MKILNKISFVLIIPFIVACNQRRSNNNLKETLIKEISINQEMPLDNGAIVEKLYRCHITYKFSNGLNFNSKSKLCFKNGFEMDEQKQVLNIENPTVFYCKSNQMQGLSLAELSKEWKFLFSADSIFIQNNHQKCFIKQDENFKVEYFLNGHKINSRDSVNFKKTVLNFPPIVK